MTSTPSSPKQFKFKLWHERRDRWVAVLITAVLHVLMLLLLMYSNPPVVSSPEGSSGGGTLVVMGGTMQMTWEHTLGKVASSGPRLSIMFRHRPPAGVGLHTDEVWAGPDGY